MKEFQSLCRAIKRCSINDSAAAKPDSAWSLIAFYHGVMIFRESASLKAQTRERSSTPTVFSSSISQMLMKHSWGNRMIVAAPENKSALQVHWWDPERARGAAQEAKGPMACSVSNMICSASQSHCVPLYWHPSNWGNVRNPFPHLLLKEAKWTWKGWVEVPKHCILELKKKKLREAILHRFPSTGKRIGIL